MANSNPAPGYVLKNRTTTRDRVHKFVSDKYFTDVNLFGKLFPETLPVDSLAVSETTGRISYDDAMNLTYTATTTGTSYGPTWATHWFRVGINVPSSWLGKHVEFVWDSNSEAMVWINGEPRQGLNSSHYGRNSYTVSYSLLESERVMTLYIEMAANHLFGAGDGEQIFPTDNNRFFKLDRCDLRRVDPLVWDLYHDFNTMIGFIEAFGESNRGYQALYKANEMVNIVDHSDRNTYQAARDLAQEFLSKTNGSAQHTVCAVGNCHIDTAWLWPYAETKRKCARSWSTSIRLMEKYSNFIFAASQAQQFEWVKQDYPTLYTEMKNYTTSGQFYPVGGTWVEMDGNVPSGEGMARQFLLGQRFFKQEFGKHCTEFWLPDTFGYSPQLPQIVTLSGIDRFVTQKISWNLVNKFPHNSFWWQGIDGTRLLSHFPPADSYVMQGKVEEIQKTVDQFKDKGRNNVSLYLYGHGDGGQGPDAPMLERLTRMANVDNLPKVQLTTPNTFFELFEAIGTDQLCVWKGELYLELHNGTYTTRAKIKKNNRQTEFLLCHAETAGTLATIFDGAATYSYPTVELLRLWKLVLLNQFHDVLPGTSIQIAHEDALAYYADVQSSGGNLLSSAVTAFFSAINGPAPAPVDVVFNMTSWDRTEVVTVPADTTSTALTQVDRDGNVLVMDTCPSLGFCKLVGFETIPNSASVTSGTNGSFTLDNGLVKADIDSTGRITGLFVNGGTKNAIAEGEFGNQLLLFDDVPMYWDAWDVMDYHLETMKPVVTVDTAANISESGPLRASIKVVLRISSVSTITQYIELEAGSRYIRFSTEVDWNESHKFLKVEFPANLHTQSATYECQYGFHERPTHMNTSWDWAKYEVCGHKWADVSEYNWGLSVLNDCKYGWSCIGNRLRLSLLRSPKNPDPTSDMGIQTFKYAVFPHEGSFQDAGVIQAAWQLNVPLQVYKGVQVSDLVPVNKSYVQTDNSSIIVGALKLAEDEPNALVMRLYEAYGGRTSVTVSVPGLPNGILSAQMCNLIEDVQGSSLIVTNDSFTLDFTPFQIQSVKIVFKTPTVQTATTTKK